MKNRYVRLLIIIILIITSIFVVKSLIKSIYTVKYSTFIIKYSKEYNMDPCLVVSVIKTEGNFNRVAESSKGAKGLMQITDDTALWIAEQMKLDGFKLEDLYDVETNIKMGTWYLDNLSKEFNGNVTLVLAAYNGGRGNVNNWLQSSEHSPDGENLKYIPFKETDKYVKRVKVNYNIYKFIYPKLGV